MGAISITPPRFSISICKIRAFRISISSSILGVAGIESSSGTAAVTNSAGSSNTSIGNSIIDDLQSRLEVTVGHCMVEGLRSMRGETVCDEKSAFC